MSPKNEVLKDAKWTYLLRWVLILLVTPLWLIGLGATVLAELFFLQPRLSPPSAIPVACAVTTNPEPQTPAELYLDLLKKTLTRAQVAGPYERHTLRPSSGVPGRAYSDLVKLLQTRGFELVSLKAPNLNAYMGASNFNLGRLEDGETMVGLKQLDNIQFCVTDVLHRKTPGDLIETGTWRGGVTIMMRAVLKAYGDKGRKVWVADSF